jgi:hypothetical protein
MAHAIVALQYKTFAISVDAATPTAGYLPLPLSLNTLNK